MVPPGLSDPTRHAAIAGLWEALELARSQKAEGALREALGTLHGRLLRAGVVESAVERAMSEHAASALDGEEAEQLRVALHSCAEGILLEARLVRSGCLADLSRSSMSNLSARLSTSRALCLYFVNY